jgi:CelD/BcsL family acetyltransferase involved in cellulose biosynthesis
MLEQPQSNIFHYPGWADLLAACYGFRPFVAAVCDSEGSIQAGVPIMEVKGPFLRHRWIALPFSDHCGALYRDTESLNQLTDTLISLSKDKTMPFIELHGEYPYNPSIQTHSEYVLHTVDLSSDANTVFNRFHHMHRRNINKAQREQVRIEWGESQEAIHAFYRLHLKSRHRKGIPVQPKRFFELLWSKIIAQGLGFVLLAYIHDECIAGAVFLHWQNTLTYKYGAFLRDARNLRPNNLIFWEAIRWGCRNGFTKLDMGRAAVANTGLRTFKNGWGADEVPLVYSMLPPRSSHTATGKLTDIAQAVIRLSPEWVGRATGELLYRYFA